MSEIISPLAYQLGLGGIGGFIVGFAVKKLSKLIAILIGLFIIALIYLGTQGIISINYGALWEKLEGVMGFLGQAFSWLIGLISIIPFMGSFVVGFLLGFKLG
ncbi:MAG: FUN14 domain-containing protein [Candidatus Bathyarchaeales archaeon]